MADVSLSLVIPTISRPSLARTLLSTRGERLHEVIILADGRQDQAWGLVKQISGVKYLEYKAGPCKDWGHTPRNWVCEKHLATGTHLMFLDDDDVLAPDAGELIHSVLLGDNTSAHVFRMDATHWGNWPGVYWNEPELRLGNVGSPMLVAKNDPGLLGRFKPHYGGDFDFIRDTCSLHGNTVWHKEVTSIIRPPL